MIVLIVQLNEILDPVYDTQVVSRLLLDCMARPGKINYLPDVKLYIGKEYSFSFPIARTLLDCNVSFTYLGSAKKDFSDEIIRCTGSRLAHSQQADFIFCDAKEQQPELALARSGILEFPNLGATVVMMVSHLFDELPQSSRDLTRVEFAGPDMQIKADIWLAGIHSDNLKWLSQQNQTHSLGKDVILVDREGRVACVPKSSQPVWEVDANELYCS